MGIGLDPGEMGLIMGPRQINGPDGLDGFLGWDGEVFLGFLTVEIEGREGLQEGRGAAELGFGVFGWLFLLLGDGEEEDGYDCHVDEDEKDGRGEPALHGGPDGR